MNTNKPICYGNINMVDKATCEQLKHKYNCEDLCVQESIRRDTRRGIE